MIFFASKAHMLVCTYVHVLQHHGDKHRSARDPFASCPFYCDLFVACGTTMSGKVISKLLHFVGGCQFQRNKRNEMRPVAGHIFKQYPCVSKLYLPVADVVF